MNTLVLRAALIPGLFGCLLVAAMDACAVGAGRADDGDELEKCTPASAVRLLASETATAGYLSNILNQDGSIRAASSRMLNKALDTARSKQPTPLVVFTSTPELSKKSATDDQMCTRYEKSTEKVPIQFSDKHFATADELTDWIMEFTRGKGADGESLYNLCPGRCSPRYTWWIEPAESGMNVRTRVVCGLPRDRDGNRYLLTTELGRACPAEKNQGAETPAQ